MLYSTQRIHRRELLLGALATCLVPFGNAISKATDFPELSLKMYNLHTSERIKTVFWEDGEFNLEGLRALNYFLRDHRTGQIKQIDTRLFSILYLLNKKIDNNGEIIVISGYRSPKTNRLLAQNNPAVAKKSYHVKGRAIDIRIPGKSTKVMRDISINLGVGGVGYYSRSDFIHLDTGPRRTW